ncbi:class I SAM-dependent methyltransferase [Nocardioides iriomotensis]|uniref:Class I SAM-dependent methyltransferase n=1 Tax=Nocardioides iriomotensis TaxID=715784 RepID=A0A4V1Z2I3_9ACTN|nr:class I SAM-dependent methyltransferase [Nocardioides iriomotensis]RYU14506.1 class I SAM-dependent methyltransferase [Nocardioides iriomotensis]
MSTHLAITLLVVAFLLLLVVQVVILFYVRGALTGDEASEPVDEEPQPHRRTETAGLVGRLRRNGAEQHSRTVREIEALIDLRALVPARTTMPSTQGWAASPLTVSALVREVLETRPQLVVEAGSGGSSVWVGYCLERNGGGRCVSLDHDADYAAKTRADIERHGLTDYVEVVHCPLVSVDVAGETFQWYDLSKVEGLDGIDIVFVDGPPGTTGPLARYPAFPVLRDRCAPGARFILDDAARPDEKAIVHRWTHEHGATVVDRTPGPLGCATVRAD